MARVERGKDVVVNNMKEDGLIRLIPGTIHYMRYSER
jgi:hypothetical protein